MLHVGDRERGEDRVLAVARVLAYGDHRVPVAAAAGRDVDGGDLDARLLQHASQRGLVDRRAHPDVLPRHVERVVDRVAPHRDRLDADLRIEVEPAHQARELAEAAFGLRPADRQDFCLQHDLGIRDARRVDRLARRQEDRLAAQAAGDRQLADADRRLVRRGHQLERMSAEADRDRQRAARRVRLLGELAQVVRRDDVDPGEVALLDLESIDAGVQPVLGVAGQRDAGGDHRPAVVDGEERHGKREEIEIVAGLDDLLHGAARDHHGLERMIEPVTQLRFALRKAAAHRDRDAVPALDEPGQHRHLVPGDVAEEQRGLRLVDQRRDVPDVDGLLDFDQFAGRAEIVEQRAECRRHQLTWGPRHGPHAPNARKRPGRAVALLESARDSGADRRFAICVTPAGARTSRARRRHGSARRGPSAAATPGRRRPAARRLFR